MVLTRSGSASPVKKSAASKAESLTKAPMEEALRIVIAPKELSQAVRFISLTNPVDGKPQRYLFCPQKGVYELKQVTVPKHDPRSVLFVPDGKDGGALPKDEPLGSGYVNRSAEYCTATPYDLCFTLLPIVSQSSKNNLFQNMDDLLETSMDEALDLRYVVTHARSLVEESLESICDSIEAGDDSMYRYSASKTLQLLIAKARRVYKTGLPATLEDRFVTRILEAPVLSVKREESTISIVTEPTSMPERTETPTPSETFDSQSSAASTAPSVVFSEASIATEVTVATVVPESSIPEDIRSLQRLVTAFKFITACYMSLATANMLQTLLRSPESGIDFAPLDLHLTNLAKLRAEVAASTDLASFSRKRNNFEDDEELEDRAEKKRKLDEEEKRKKANMSHGVKALAKVNTKGMKKMSAFFAPKPSKPAG